MTELKRAIARCTTLYHRWRKRSVAVFVFLLASFSLVTWAMISSSQLPLVASLHPAQAEHIDQQELNDLVRSGQTAEAFEEAFEHGDELFETNFNAADGSGAKVGNGQRFTRMPRADLRQTGQWATHFPARVTGPNAQKCNACHNLPEDDGAGGAEANVHRDPFHTAD